MTHFTDDQITELIAEARQATFCRCYHESQEQECGIHGDAHSRLVGGLADALEARQPSEDDREVLARLLAAQDGEEWDRLVGTAEYARNRYLRKAGAILDRMPKLSRAAVPDTATERARQAEAELRDMLRVDIPSLKAERDAALEALERVREIHERDMVLHDYCSECSDFGSDQFPPGQMIEWPCPTVAALDGEPAEPAVTTDWKATANSCDALLRAVMGALGIRPDQDPVLEARKIAERAAAPAATVVTADQAQAILTIDHIAQATSMSPAEVVATMRLIDQPQGVPAVVEVTDAMADAAAIAMHDFVFGPDDPMTERDLGIVRQAWKVAIQAALGGTE